MSSVFLPRTFLTVDLMVPDVPFLLTSEPENGSAALSVRTETPRVRESWIRLALVNGVDRWLEAPRYAGLLDEWNEGLLLADLACAHGQAGNDELSGHFWELSRPALEELVWQVLNPTSAERLGYQALLSELRTVYAAAPFMDDRIAAELLLLGGQSPSLHPELQEWMPGLISVRSKGHTAASKVIPGPVEVHADPRLVPARLFAAEPQAFVQNDEIRLSGAAFPGLTAATPAAARMLARVFTKHDQRVVSLGILKLSTDGESFTSTLKAQGQNAANLIIEIFDGDSVVGPFVFQTEDGLNVANLQVAFTLARLGGARRALGRTVPRGEGDSVLSKRWAHQAEILWTWARDAAPDGIDLSAIAPMGATEGPLRPLLAELASALGTKPA